MISPRSQESQFTTQAHYQPYNSNTATAPEQMTQAPPQLSHISSGGSYNLNYNNNYTTAIAVPPTTNTSFSLPSVPQTFYYEQQGGQPQQQISHFLHSQHSTPQLPFQQVGQGSTNEQQGQGDEKIQQPQQRSQTSYYPQTPLPYFQPGVPLHQGDFQYGYIMAQQAHDPSQIPLGIPQPHLLHHPPLVQSVSAPNLQSAGQQIGEPPSQQPQSEEVSFPGTLDTQYRANGQYHPRAQTYPNLDSTKIKRISSASSNSLLGMTPETARRNRCNICQKQFKRPSSLQTHLFSHTGEKPFACSWENCGRLFSVRSNMIRHRKLHERDAKLKNEDDESVSPKAHGIATQKAPAALENPHMEKELQSVNSHGNSLPSLLHQTNQASGAPVTKQEFPLQGW